MFEKFEKSIIREALVADWPKDTDPIECPKCGDTNNHPCGTVITSGEDDKNLNGYWDVTDSGAVYVNNEEGILVPNRSRGNDVIINFTCESGCRWARRYLFHKGCTYTDNVVLPDSPYKQSIDKEPFNEADLPF